MPRVVVATSNQGKLRELVQLLRGLNMELLPQSAFAIAPVEESGASFVENALLKARHASARASLASIADDSGLEVDVLDGKPGIFSARFANPDSTDADNNAKLIASLSALGAPRAAARYRCAIVFVQSTDDPTPLIAEASWEGEIIDQPKGDNGFGYDPYFWLPSLGLTAAQLSAEEKNRLSHRGQALRKLREQLGQRQ